MLIKDLPTPCLVLDRAVLMHNIRAMNQVAARNRVSLRAHMKTAKSIDVARLVCAANGVQTRGITVSTLAEAEYFSSHDISDILLAAGITPERLDQVAKLNVSRASIIVLTDDLDMARRIAKHDVPPRVLIEIDTGEHRGGVTPDDPALLAIAERLGESFAGVMTHGGHSYGFCTAADIGRVAEAERAGVVRAAERLRAAGHAVDIVSMGSSPTAVHAADLSGITELRAGVYMFGDLFQCAIGTHGPDDIALTVLASVIGRRAATADQPARLLLDAGALALSKDRSTSATNQDAGFGAVLALDGTPAFGGAVVGRAWQEHGLVELQPDCGGDLPAIGEKVRVVPNHACLTAAAHDRYFVVDAGEDVIAVWPRVNGW